MHLSKAGVVKLVDTLDLGSSAQRRGGSSPFTRTKKPPSNRGFFALILNEIPTNSIDEINEWKSLYFDQQFML